MFDIKKGSEDLLRHVEAEFFVLFCGCMPVDTFSCLFFYPAKVFTCVFHDDMHFSA